MNKTEFAARNIYDAVITADPVLSNFDRFLSMYAILSVMTKSEVNLEIIDERIVKAFTIGIRDMLEGKHLEIEKNINWEEFPRWYKQLYDFLDAAKEFESSDVGSEIYTRAWFLICKNALAIFAHVTNEFLKFVQEEDEFRKANKETKNAL